jgi:hypothetical protein
MRRPHRGLRYGAAILPTACGMAKTRAAQAIEYFAALGVAVKEIKAAGGYVLGPSRRSAADVAR